MRFVTGIVVGDQAAARAGAAPHQRLGIEHAALHGHRQVDAIGTVPQDAALGERLVLGSLDQLLADRTDRLLVGIACGVLVAAPGARVVALDVAENALAALLGFLERRQPILESVDGA
jgi:hypothetical protein